MTFKETSRFDFILKLVPETSNILRGRKFSFCPMGQPGLFVYASVSALSGCLGLVLSVEWGLTVGKPCGPQHQSRKWCSVV